MLGHRYAHGCPAGPVIGCGCPELPGPARAHAHRISRRRHHRHARPYPGAEADRCLGAERRDREPAGRRRQYRRGGCGQVGARWLHHSLRSTVAGGQRDLAAKQGVRSGQGFRPRDAGRHRAGRAGGFADLAVPFGERADRLRQGTSERAQLCLARHRHQRPSGDRDVRRSRRHQAAARALHIGVAGGDRRDVGPHRGIPADARRPHRQHRLGTHACARGLRSGARSAAPRHSDLQGTRHRLRGRDQLVRAVRAEGHAQGDHRQDQCRRDQDIGDAGCEGESGHARLSLCRRLTGTTCDVPEPRNCQMGRGSKERVVEVMVRLNDPHDRCAPFPACGGGLGWG